MQSAFASPSQQYDTKPFVQWNGMYSDGLGAAAGAATAPPPQQGMQTPQGLPQGVGGAMNPDTPQAAKQSFNQLWQAAVNTGGEFSPNDSLEPEPEEPEEAETPAKQRKTKGKKSPGQRSGDKVAKAELRMIKNRESAARSRLRRQQHTTQLEQENEQLRAQVAGLMSQVQTLTHQVDELNFQLQLSRMPNSNMQRASVTVSQNQHISALPPAPSLSLSLPAASSLLLPPVALDNLAADGGIMLPPQEGGQGLSIVDGFGRQGFDFYTSRRGSSFA